MVIGYIKLLEFYHKTCTYILRYKIGLYIFFILPTFKRTCVDLYSTRLLRIRILLTISLMQILIILST